MNEPTNESSGYFKAHSALANWLRPAGTPTARLILEQDGDRSTRLAQLHEIMGLPVIPSVGVSVEEVQNSLGSAKLQELLGGGPMAARILRSGTVVARNRNLSADEVIEWVHGEDLQPDDLVEFTRHIPNEHSAIFVNAADHTIGEAVEGSLRILTQGGPGSGAVAHFVRDDGEPQFGRPAASAALMETVARAIGYTKTNEEEASQLLSAGFSVATNGYLEGYYEVISNTAGEIFFIDMNPTLGSQVDALLVSSFSKSTSSSERRLGGVTASTGQAEGAAVVFVGMSEAQEIPFGSVVVCEEPSPSLIDQLGKIAGLVVDRGGVLAHASVVCRELGIPCVVAVGNATELIPQGSLVRVNGDEGLVTLLGAGAE